MVTHSHGQRPRMTVDPYSYALRKILTALDHVEPHKGAMSDYEYSILESIRRVIEHMDPGSMDIVRDRPAGRPPMPPA